MKQHGIIYISSPGGHRQSYMDLFQGFFPLDPVCSEASQKTFRTLWSAPKLLYATTDDNIPFFVIVTITRGLFGKPTAALFLRPQSCLDQKSWKSRIKGRLFRILKKVPKLCLITIIPFEFAPRYAEVAHKGVHDPQFWDMLKDGKLKSLPKTSLSEDIITAANGRKILCYIGRIDKIKGFGFLAEILENDPKIRQNILFVAAGTVLENSEKSRQKFEAAGGYLVNRLIDDDELESLYGIADMIWSCYHPSYDQASGIFGRAVQYGIPVLVRKNSFISRFASGLGAPSLRLEFDNIEQARKALKEDFPSKISQINQKQHLDTIASWQHHFMTVIEHTLEIECKKTSQQKESR